MKFIVDRKTWYRGHGSAASCLLNDHGERCCIGFVGQQCGVPEEDLLGFRAIHAAMQIFTSLSEYPTWMSEAQLQDQPTRFPMPNPDLIEAYKTNDDPGINDTDRETRLIAIFKRNGDELEFVN